MRELNFTFNENSWMTKLLYKPLFNVLMLFYVYIPGQDFGVAIIALTLLIRIILFPSYIKTLKSQRALKKIQPLIDDIKAKHKDDQAQQSKELMKVYAEHKVNPLSSCLPLLIQLPILFALYRVFTVGLNADSLNHLYTWFPNMPETINTVFLSFTGIESLMVDLAVPSLFLAITAGVVQLIQSFMMSKMTPMPKGGGMANMITKQMMYFFPIITVFIAMSLPAALALYWVATTFFTVLQQVIVMGSFKKADANVATEVILAQKEDKAEAIAGTVVEETKAIEGEVENNQENEESDLKEEKEEDKNNE